MQHRCVCDCAYVALLERVRCAVGDAVGEAPHALATLLDAAQVRALVMRVRGCLIYLLHSHIEMHTHAHACTHTRTQTHTRARRPVPSSLVQQLQLGEQLSLHSKQAGRQLCMSW